MASPVNTGPKTDKSLTIDLNQHFVLKRAGDSSFDVELPLSKRQHWTSTSTKYAFFHRSSDYKPTLLTRWQEDNPGVVSRSSQPSSSGTLDHSAPYRPSTQRQSPVAPRATLDSAPDYLDSPPGDQYALEETEERAMLELLDLSTACTEPIFAPSSVIREQDHDSRSPYKFDPRLQHSNPDEAPPGAHSGELDNGSAADANKTIKQNEDLMDEDVDWEAVVTAASFVLKDASLMGSREAESIHVPSGGPELVGATNRPQAALPDNIELAPFVRPPFPDGAPAQSMVPGLSSSTVLRTCFRIGELVSQTNRCYHQNQDAIFELYARVSYSSREKLARKQHFQFIDLFNDNRPYPTGTLSDWRLESSVDYESRAFLDRSGLPKLCWCLCKPEKDPSATVRWKYVVLGIFETDWRHIREMKDMVCGPMPEEDQTSSPSTLAPEDVL